MKVLVLGGRGFIGRHVVAALSGRGFTVVVGSRDGRAGRFASPTMEVRRTRFEALAAAADWRAALVDIDVVVNCVGILRARPGESYDAIHHRAPAALACACVAAGVGKLVHVSALGLHAGSTHGFLTSKRAGEAALGGHPLDVVIVRPSLLDGTDGFGSRWMRRMARMPVHFVPDAAVGRIAALDVDDLGAAIATLCAEPIVRGLRTCELGGLDRRTLAEHLQALRRGAGKAPARTVQVPAPLSRLGARVCDLLHWSPYSAGHLELLGRDNLPRDNRLPALLGRAPKSIGRGPAAVAGAIEAAGASGAVGRLAPTIAPRAVARRVRRAP